MAVIKWKILFSFLQEKAEYVKDYEIKGICLFKKSYSQEMVIANANEHIFVHKSVCVVERLKY